MSAEHSAWMKLALEEANLARSEDEIPVGAVLVKGGELIAAEHNRTRQLKDPLAHAEKLLIDKILASKIKYLQDYTLYVTLEPCLMCAGMMIWSRLGTLVYGASDPKAGAVGSIYNVLADKSFNHHPRVLRGVLEADCAALLRDFFQSRRQ
ncbi:MAG TPA: tRNA adenosine(34) deaminase TadA [Candidatus Syntrophosphaera sp.]|jgi:tRNA(adenine34) deaminase|nr:tRNA adenosine(34) deaminase TadA [Candidatus Cloacimonadota bacterium]HOR02549.1 tRNA adenosine(34) deaminase TadA [Candidatus Syntrophosphaera sp.]HOU71862.1 tRNA adenosine(34) deaminase TadA [Candidatus Syntrophosphaera sp.]HPB44174.1 tRNA adenosine(34) deaminase TadA [Candidatus Syntrophosphaera sp.]HPK82555.1 tRNA adenosine(34) deaminase TadA [Candidatus Syntrophosphaera sp.]